MMRGEYYSPPPAPPKPVEKVRRKKAAPKAPPIADMLPPEDYGAGADTLGLSTGPKKDEADEEKQYVFI